MITGDARIALHRRAEAAHRWGGARSETTDFSTYAVTWTEDPDRYRVRRLGPFECVLRTVPNGRRVTPDVADALCLATSTHLPVLVEGSQSPLAVKAPAAGSDVDVLIAVQSPEDLPEARRAYRVLTGCAHLVGALISPGIVHRSWLTLAPFYSALDLSPRSPDRKWWQADESACFAEARRRIGAGLAHLRDEAYLMAVLRRSLEIAGWPFELDEIIELSLTPRWRGLESGS